MADLKTEAFELRITAGKAVSTDRRFRADDLRSGGHYMPLDTYFIRTDGTLVRRATLPKEPPVSVQTLPRLACQVFEKDLAALSDEERAAFPICRNAPDRDVIRGIYPSREEYEKDFPEKYKEEYERQGHRPGGVTYTGGGRRFVLYNWSVFSPILFAQECLRRFGGPRDEFVLKYREKDKE